MERHFCYDFSSRPDRQTWKPEDLMTARTAIKNTALFGLAIIAVSLFCAGRGYADGPAYADWLAGSWRGFGTTAKGTRFRIDLDVPQAKPDKVTLNFSAPAYCDLNLEAPKQDGDTVTFTVSYSNGGLCSLYLPGTAQFQKRPENDRLVLRLQGRTESAVVQTLLTRLDSTPKAAPAKAAKPKFAKP